MNRAINKILSLLLAAALALTLLPITALAAPAGAFEVTGTAGGWSYAGNTLTITANGTYTIGMATANATTTTDKIVVQPGVTAAITLNGVSIDVSIDVSETDGACAFNMTGATVNLTISGTSTLKSGGGRAGLEAPAGAALTIGGTGTLNAYGGTNGFADGAGIGGGGYDASGIDGGAITINSGTVNATGGMMGGSGIGGGYDGTGIDGMGDTGTITINGGTVTASGGVAGAGIGGAGGSITISGGTVTANGGGQGAGIGGAGGSAGGTITISGGTVTANGGGSGAGIGGGSYGAGGNISIRNAAVTATGGASTENGGIGGGAGIGGGGGQGEDTAWGWGGWGGVVTISNSTVVATGGAAEGEYVDGGAGIGGGGSSVSHKDDHTSGSAGGIVAITGGTVTASASDAMSIGGGGANRSIENVYGAGGTLEIDGGAKLILQGHGTNADFTGKIGVCEITDVTGVITGKYNLVTVINGSSSATDTQAANWKPGVYINGATVQVAVQGLDAQQTFSGWAAVPSVAFSSQNATPATFTMPAYEVTVTAQINVTSSPDENYFGVNEGKITIEPGTDPDTVKVTYGASLTKDNIPKAEQITIAGTSADSGKTIVAQGGVTANVTLKNLSVDVSGTANAAAFEITGNSTVNLTLSNLSILKSGTNRAGLYVTGGNSVTIDGAGSLTANGGQSGAGIGGGFNTGGGNITISGGTVTANSGAGGGAGIGGGIGGAGGNITINGGAVTAASNAGAAIGSGQNGAGGNILIYGENTTVAAKSISAGQDIGAGVGGTIGGVFVALPQGKLTLSAQTANTVAFTASPASSGTVAATLPAPFSTAIDVLSSPGVTAKNLSVVAVPGTESVSFALAGYSSVAKTGAELMTNGAAVAFLNSPPTVVPLQGTQSGIATLASDSGNPALRPYTANVSEWFTDADGDTLTYAIVSEDAEGTVTLNPADGALAFLPAEADGGLTRTIVVKANDGVFDSTGNVTISVAVGQKPMDEAPQFASPAEITVSVGGTDTFNVHLGSGTANGIPGPVYGFITENNATIATASQVGQITAQSTDVTVTGVSLGTATFTVTYDGGLRAGQSDTITVKVTDSPVVPDPLSPDITTAGGALTNGLVNTAYSETIAATNNPTSFSVITGMLPEGLTLGSGGVIAGTPTIAGKRSFSVAATNANGSSAAVEFSIMIAAVSGPPVISTPAGALSGGSVGGLYSEAISASNAPASFAVSSGALPAGLRLGNDGVISGTPTSAGTYNFSIIAANAMGNSSPTAFSITVAPATPVAADFTIGNLTQTVGGVTAVTVTPKDGKSQGTITIYYSGNTTLPITAGSYTVTFDVAADAANHFAAATGLAGGTLVISAASATKTVSVAAQSGTLTAGTAGSATFTVTTANIANNTYTATLGGAPTGVTTGNVEISGNSGTLTLDTTTATPQGTHALTLTIDGATSGSFNLVVGAAPATVPGAPTIGTATAGNGQASVAFTAPTSNGGAEITSYTVTSSGGQTATDTESPITVTGLTNGTAYTFTVTATNSAGTGAASSASNSVTPAAPPTFVAVTGITGVPTTATVGTAITLSGTVAPSNATNQTIVWSGTGVSGNQFTPASAGTATVTATITNGLTASSNYTQSFNITVSAAPPTVTNVSVSPSAIEVEKGTTQQFAATVLGTNDPAQTVTWSLPLGYSGNSTIDNSGLLTVAAGETEATLTVTATSTVDTGKSGSAIATVTSIPPNPVYGVSLDASETYTFTAATAGYGAQTAKTVKIANTGNQATGALNIALSGTNADSFTLSTANIVNIANGGNTTFTVAPNTGLTAGTYTATVTVSGGNSISASFNVSFTVNSVSYPVINDLGQWSGSGALAAKIDGDYTKFVRLLRNGNLVATANYTVTAGSTIITLKESYLQTLTTGTHTFVAEFSDGKSGDITLTVQSNSGGNGNGNGNGNGGGTPPTDPTKPTTPPTTSPTPAPGGTTTETPTDKPPVSNSDGSVTLPGGGTVTTPDGEKVTVPPGSKIDKDGNITVGTGGGKVENGGVTVNVPGGSTVTPEGKVTIGKGGGSITYDSGHTFSLPEGAVIIFDEDVPLGYFIDIANPFTDVKAGDWFYDDVLFVYAHGLLVGTSVNPPQFSPNMNTTRGMVATLIYRLAGEPNVSGLANPFADVASGKWYSDATKWAAANGIIAGYNGNFSPDSNITREDLAVILYRYADYAGLKLPASRTYAAFADDSGISDYARAAIEAFYRAGIINGKPGNLLDPQGTATRAELAAILHRFLIVINGGEIPLAGTAGANNNPSTGGGDGGANANANPNTGADVPNTGGGGEIPALIGLGASVLYIVAATKKKRKDPEVLRHK